MPEKITYDIITVSVQPRPGADVSDYVPSILWPTPNHLIIETYTHSSIFSEIHSTYSSDGQSLCLQGAVTLKKPDPEDLNLTMNYCFIIFQPLNGAPIVIGDEENLNGRRVWKPRILDCCLKESVMGNC
jgi:hypothetical protein